jgi:hypothetical protein
MTQNIDAIIMSILKVLVIYLFFRYKSSYQAMKYIVFSNNHLKNNRFLEKMDHINQDLILKEKQEFINFIQKHTRGNSSSINLQKIKYIFIGTRTSYENLLLILSKAVFYCEIVGCKKIILDKRYYWFINKMFRFKKYKLMIAPDYKKNIEYNNVIFDHTLNLVTYNKFIFPENKIYLFKDEILKNLPKVVTSPNELYIYIKSGDIFMKTDSLYHIQSPLCFYRQVIEKYSTNFTNITIVSEQDKNIGINKLMMDYPNITFNVIPVKITFSYLTKAYNIAAGNCHLLYFIIRLNDNLRNIWEYDTQNDINNLNNENTNIEGAIKYLKYIEKRNINYYKMVTSKYYKDTQLYSKNTFYRFYLMFNHKCGNFTLVN